VSALKKTGLLVFLDRPVEELRPAEDRPLADSIEKIRTLYNERYPVYSGAADIRVDSRGTPETVLNTVLDQLEKAGERLR
jgi:shikimate kinase